MQLLNEKKKNLTVLDKYAVPQLFLNFTFYITNKEK